MGIFYSPMKLIDLIKNSGSITKELKEHSGDWYFSKEGKKTYNEAKTPAKKTMFFFDYLTAVAKSKDKREVLYRIAYIMANSMDDSSLDFAGYPNILDAEKNPLVKYVKTRQLIGDNNTAFGLLLLAAFQGENDAQKLANAKHKPYNRLTYCAADGKMSDEYKIERNIIGAFCTDFSESYIMPPYLYEIVESADDDENE